MKSGKLLEKIDSRVLLSSLWIVVMFNMLKADILSLYIPGAADEVVQFAGATPIPQLMLGAAVIMEIAIVMIALALVLPYRLNRWANIVVAVLMIVFVIGGGSTYPHYIFIAAVEVISLLLIIGIAWRWRAALAN
jgi:hypothetical protein